MKLTLWKQHAFEQTSQIICDDFCWWPSLQRSPRRGGSADGPHFLCSIFLQKATGCKTSFVSLFINAKPEPDRYAIIAASELSSIPGWQTTKPKPRDKKSVRRTTRQFWLKRIKQGSERIASFMSSIERWAASDQSGATGLVYLTSLLTA